MSSDIVIVKEEYTMDIDGTIGGTLRETEMVSDIVAWDRKISCKEDIDFAAKYDLDLKIVLKKYETSGTLSANDQVTICKSIAKWYLGEDHNKKFGIKDFCRISKVIVQRFPSEIEETYYTKTRSKRARGKLYDQFLHLRGLLVSVGLATKRRKYSSKRDGESFADSDTESETFAENNLNSGKPIQSLLEYLEGHSEPWDDIKVAWNATFYERLCLLNTMSPVDYFYKYPVLITNQGLELLSTDTDHLFPNSSNLLASLEKYKISLLNKIKQVKTYPFTDLLQASHQSIAWEHTLVLISLPFLFPNAYVGRVRQSKAEIASHFFPYFKTKDERDNHYDQVVLKAENQCVIIPPSIHIFGNFDHPMCVITIDKQSYHIDDPVRAFELFFKSLFALNLKYPDSSQHVWTFVQKKFFEITTEHDVSFPSVEALIKSL